MINIRTAPYAALLLRITLGAFFLAHGLMKVFVFTIPGFIKFFDSIGYPAWVAYLVLVAEIGGGLALAVGFLVKWISLILFIEMLGVIAHHWANGFAFTSKGGGWEYPAMWAIALLVQILLGPGFYSVTRRFRTSAPVLKADHAYDSVNRDAASAGHGGSADAEPGRADR